MRNLKKILALVLALMMVLSVMVTASAASPLEKYKDYASINPAYEQAVEVMTASGVFSGTDNGFEPGRVLTRQEAATLITILATGGKIDAYKVKCETNFDDVAATHWASGFITYCYENELILGTGNNQYSPDLELSYEQYAAMLLRVLGVDCTTTGKWYVPVRNNAISNGLMEGIETYVWTAGLTREAACQMTFNAMKAGSTTTPASGYWYFMQSDKEIEIAEKDIALYVALGMEVLWKGTEATSTGLFKQFGITETLAADGGKDAEGRPALVYTVDNGKDAAGNEIPDTVLAYAEAPVAIFTTDMDAVAAAAAAKALEDAKYDVKNVIIFSKDGVHDLKNSYGVALLLEQQSGNNIVVELYAGSDKVIDTAVVTKTYIEKTGKITEADAEKKTPETIKINGEDIDNTELGLAEDVYVTYNKIDGKINVETLALAEFVVGTLTGYNSKGEYIINGETYTLDMHATSAIQAQFGKSYVYYLGANNTIILATALPGEEEPEFVMPTDYAVVKGSEVKYTVTGTTPDSFAGETSTKSITFSARVKVLLADGTYAIYNLPVVKASAAITGTEVAKGDYYTVIDGAPVVLLTKAAAAAATVTAEAYTVDISSYLAAPVYAYTAADGVIDLYAVATIDKKDPTITEDTVIAGCTNGTTVASNAVVVDDYFGNKVLVNANTKVVYEYTKDEKVVTLVSTLGASDLPAGDHGMIIAADYNKDSKGNETVVYTAEMIYVEAAPVDAPEAPATDFAYVSGEYTFAGETLKVGTTTYLVYNYTAYAVDGTVITLKSTSTEVGAGLYYYDASNMIVTEGDKPVAAYSGKYNVVAGNTVTVETNYLTVTEDTVIVEVGTATLKANAQVLVFVETGANANANNIVLIYVVG